MPSPSDSLHHVCHLTKKGFQWFLSGHPWVYRDDVGVAAGEHGDIVRVHYEGRCLGSAFFGARSKIALRWIERAESPRVPDIEFWRERLRAAAARRVAIAERTDAYRIVHDVADGFPGLVLDRYGGVAVLQSTIAGIERLLETLTTLAAEVLGVSSVVARNDLAVREKEALPRRTEVLLGSPPETLWVFEEGPNGRVQFPINPVAGQKTGAFLDQRENRWAAARRARGRFLDAFSYHGLFALHAARRVEEAVAVDTSAPALELCEQAARQNGFQNIRTVQKNVFDFLKDARRAGESFDVVVLDPPAFARSKADLPAAVRAYRDINRQSMRLLAAGGTLVTCSCSYNLSEPAFLDILRDAAAESRSDFRILEIRGPASDHPTLLCHPESRYLKCALLEKV
jgi:23S rRNA (cytosine1962-C5)-methyltransferase